MNNPKRQPKGNTTGGQFAASQNAESNVDLTELEVDANLHRGEHTQRQRDAAVYISPDGNWGDASGLLLLSESDIKEVGDLGEVYDEYGDDMIEEVRNRLKTSSHDATEASELAEYYRLKAKYETPVVPEVYGLSRDDFKDIYEPMVNNFSRNPPSDDPLDNRMFEDYGDDLHYVRRQSADRIWSVQCNEYEETEIVNGFREGAKGYFVTEIPYDDDINYVVSN